MGVWSKKQEMEMKALRWASEMEAKYPSDISLSANMSMIYGSPFDVALTEGQPTTIAVVDKDSVSAALDEANGSEYKIKPCILNFASYRNPGGKFIEGSSAQEEMLCHESYLYNVLEKFDKTYYGPHRGKGATNRALYHNEAIHTPNVTFIHNGIEFKCDVLTCAAPNYAAAHRYFGVEPLENAQALKDRILFIRKIMEVNNVQTAILGAFGCGVFGQDPNIVAQYFNDIFSKSNIPTIVYAVPKGLNERNYNVFKRRIAETGV